MYLYIIKVMYLHIMTIQLYTPQSSCITTVTNVMSQRALILSTFFIPLASSLRSANESSLK